MIQKIYENEDLLKSLKSVGNIFELSLYTENKIISKFGDNKVTIKVKLSKDELKGLDVSNLAAYYYDEGQCKWLEIGGSFHNETDHFMFETNHFTQFTIAEKNNESNEAFVQDPTKPSVQDPTKPSVQDPTKPSVQDPTTQSIQDITNPSKMEEVPKTGDYTPIVWLFVVVIISGVGIVYFGRKKKKVR